MLASHFYVPGLSWVSGIMKNTCCARFHKNVFLLEIGEFSSGDSD